MKVKGGWKFFVLALVVVVMAVASLTALVVPVVGGAVAWAGDGSTAAVCQSGVAAVGGRYDRRRDHADAGNLRQGLMPCVRAGRPAEADVSKPEVCDMDVDALTLPHMAHGEADCTAKVLNVRDEPSLQGKVIGSLRVGSASSCGRLKASGGTSRLRPGCSGGRIADSLKPVKSWCGQ